jgi:hypothetical protein
MGRTTQSLIGRKNLLAALLDDLSWYVAAAHAGKQQAAWIHQPGQVCRHKPTE